MPAPSEREPKLRREITSWRKRYATMSSKESLSHMRQLDPLFGSRTRAPTQPWHLEVCSSARDAEAHDAGVGGALEPAHWVDGTGAAVSAPAFFRTPT
jgi:hypothetical protein